MTIKEFAQIIADLGGCLYTVGGYVRDTLIGLKPKDRDLMVTGLTIEQIEQLVPNAKVVGREFGVFEVYLDNQRMELALARTEKKNGTGYKGFTIYTSPDVTLEQDLARRDLTINAIALDILNDKIIDPYEGRLDLFNGIIRHVSEAFIEDPLRVYRAARFAAKYNFKIDPTTLNIMQQMKPELSTLHPSRVAGELSYVLNNPNPSKFFRSLLQAKVLDVHFSELNDLVGIEQNPIRHPEGDAFEHTMLVLDNANENMMLAFCGLVHDFGKVYGMAGHEEAGVPLVKEFCHRLGIPRQLTSAALFVTENHGKMHKLGEMRLPKIVDLMNAANKSPIGIRGMMQFAFIDGGDEYPFIEGFEIINRITARTDIDPLLRAEDKRKRQIEALKESQLFIR